MADNPQTVVVRNLELRRNTPLPRITPCKVACAMADIPIGGTDFLIRPSRLTTAFKSAPTGSDAERDCWRYS